MTHRLETDVNRLVDNIISEYDKKRDIDIVKTFMPPNKHSYPRLFRKNVRS